MKLYYCEDCRRYYLPTLGGGSGEYLAAAEALAHVLAGPTPSLIRCDPCQDIAVTQYRLERRVETTSKIAHFKRDV